MKSWVVKAIGALVLLGFACFLWHEAKVLLDIWVEYTVVDVTTVGMKITIMAYLYGGTAAFGYAILCALTAYTSYERPAFFDVIFDKVYVWTKPIFDWLDKD